MLKNTKKDIKGKMTKYIQTQVKERKNALRNMKQKIINFRKIIFYQIVIIL